MRSSHLHNVDAIYHPTWIHWEALHSLALLHRNCHMLFMEAWDCNEKKDFCNNIIDDFTKAGWVFSLETTITTKYEIRFALIMFNKNPSEISALTDLAKLKDLIFWQGGNLKDEFSESCIALHSAGLYPPSSYRRKDLNSVTGYIVPKSLLPKYIQKWSLPFAL